MNIQNYKREPGDENVTDCAERILLSKSSEWLIHVCTKLTS